MSVPPVTDRPAECYILYVPPVTDGPAESVQDGRRRPSSTLAVRLRAVGDGDAERRRRRPHRGQLRAAGDVRDCLRRESGRRAGRGEMSLRPVASVTVRRAV